MFRTVPAGEPADDVVAADLVPLSVLALDLKSPPEGWADSW
jgi:hypothetical protein